MGWLYAAAPDGQATFTGNKTQLVRCECQSDARRRYLEAIDGLLAHERQLRFETALQVNITPELITELQSAIARRRGMITLYGKPGVGKSHLLMCAINEAKARNVPAVYTTVTDVLDYLREAYHPKTDLTFDARWEMLTGCEVLALDELNEFNTTPWAMERFQRLMDERWRNLDRVLTLCATNDDLRSLPEKVASRLSDRRGQVIEVRGVDMRAVLGWEST